MKNGDGALDAYDLSLLPEISGTNNLLDTSVYSVLPQIMREYSLPPTPSIKRHVSYTSSIRQYQAMQSKHLPLLCFMYQDQLRPCLCASYVLKQSEILLSPAHSRSISYPSHRSTRLW